jgi:sulfotransferase family protein
MIIWLASYPRSGNTLLRLIFKEVFGSKTYGKGYRAPGEHIPALHDLTGTAQLDGPWPEAYPRMTASRELCLVKTHDPPEDNAKTVYVARNGLAAVISYQHYLHDLQQRTFSLEDIILGKPRFGSWGYHLDLWQPFDRPNTLFLKYEDLVERPDEQIDKVSEFCGLRPQKTWTNEFDKLHALHPAFFRKGQTGDASADFSEAQRDLFWSLHGDWMQRLGYAAEFDAWKALPQLRRALRDHTHTRPAEQMAADAPEAKLSPFRRALAGIFSRPRVGL